MSAPLRHSREAVERYRSYMDLVSKNFPTPVTIDPAPLATDTFACRFRDAVRGVTGYNSGDEKLLAAVSQWCNNFVVANIKGTSLLMIGERQAVKRKLATKASIGTVIDANLSPLDVVDSPSQKVLEAIVILMDHSVIEYATLTNTNLQQVQQAVLAATIRPIEVVEQNGAITLL